MYVGKQMSITEISKSTGRALSTVRYALKKAGVLRHRADAIRLAGSAGKLGGGMRGKTRTLTDECRRKISESRQKWAEKHAVGVSLKPSGYLEYTRGKNKHRHVHVVVMERLIGRRLFANEVVHHKDEDKTNNSIENLELMTRAEHARLHGEKTFLTRRRSKDGKFE